MTSKTTTTQVGRTRRPTSDGVSIILLFLSWPACLVHRFWNNSTPNKGHWFLTDVDMTDGSPFTQDVQWYVFDTGNMLSVSLIILSIVLIDRKTPSYRIALNAVFIISIIDIIHYWLCYKQSELIVLVEGLIMLLAASLILSKQWKKVLKYGRL